MKILHKISLLVAAMTALAAGPASAGTSTTTLSVTATVSANCTIASTPVAFGTYNTITGTAVNATGTVSITCTKGTAATITLDNGANFSTTRRMTDAGGDFLSYTVGQPPNTTPATACTFPAATAWSTTGAGIFSPAAAPSKVARSFNVCGTITAAQDVAAGSFADTITATVNF